VIPHCHFYLPFIRAIAGSYFRLYLRSQAQTFAASDHHFSSEAGKYPDIFGTLSNCHRHCDSLRAASRTSSGAIFVDIYASVQEFEPTAMEFLSFFDVLAITVSLKSEATTEPSFVIVARPFR
jgi:hypothetical protein